MITTEVLSEGVNLHRANVVINYDIPWNPTHLMQRAGRINRVDTDFKQIYTYNFFPSKQGNDIIKLQESAESKIDAFISMLGNDAKLLTEHEVVESHELFDKLMSKETITGEEDEEESPLKYLEVIKEVRDENPNLFDHIKRLPVKARTARDSGENANKLLTYFRKGKLEKFYLADNNEAHELDFVSAAEYMEVTAETSKKKKGDDFYSLLNLNKDAFKQATREEAVQPKGKGGRDSATQLLNSVQAIQNAKVFTDKQDQYLKRVQQKLEEGGFPKQTSKTALNELKAEMENGNNPRRLYAVLEKNIPDELLESHRSEPDAKSKNPREVILSEYLVGE